MEQIREIRLRRTGLVLSAVIIILSASLISAIALWRFDSDPLLEKPLPEGFYLGLTSGGNVTEIKELIDKVKSYMNLIIFTDLDITMNQTRLEEVSDYAFDADMSFSAFMVYPAPLANFTFNPITWASDAKVTYGDKFLGFYLWDEPGGHQLDRGNFRQFDNTTMPYDYRDAANTYVYYLYIQMRDFIKTESLFTTDYGLYWYDYEAGYDFVLSQFGWNLSRPLNIAQCRGAAEMHNKTWGAMITWTYMEPPYIASPSEVYEDMMTAYNAGGQYVTVFNYPQVGEYGVLSEGHFDAIKEFKRYVSANPQNETSNLDRVAYVLPDNYGFGLRRPDDTIWGVWNADDKSQIIWEDAMGMVEQYGDRFDIIVGSPWTRLFGKYHYDKLIWWNNATAA